jgi:hypothetical protein
MYWLCTYDEQENRLVVVSRRRTEQELLATLVSWDERHPTIWVLHEDEDHSAPLPCSLSRILRCPE